MKKAVLWFLAGFLLCGLLDAFAASAASESAMMAAFNLQQAGARFLVEANGWKQWNHTLYEQRQQAEAQHSPDSRHVVLPFGSPVRLEIPKDCTSTMMMNAVKVTCPDGTNVTVQGFPSKWVGH